MSNLDYFGTSANPNKNDVTKVRDGRDFKFSIPYKVTKEQALKLQEEVGYHPAGYGFYKFSASDDKSTWVCMTSCD